MNAPGPEPEPPDDLAERPLPLRTFAATDTSWYRGHQRRYSPIHFNQERGRFRTDEGTLYLGADPRGAFLEAFVQQVSGGPGNYVVSQEVLRRSCLCMVAASRPLQLVDLTTGVSLRSLSASADARISTGTHAMSQRWAQAFSIHPDRPDGILFPCRRSPELLSVALFARTEADLTSSCLANLLHDSAALARILDHYECALVP